MSQPGYKRRRSSQGRRNGLEIWFGGGGRQKMRYGAQIILSITLTFQKDTLINMLLFLNCLIFLVGKVFGGNYPLFPPTTPCIKTFVCTTSVGHRNMKTRILPLRRAVYDRQCHYCNAFPI